jgi:hypothetical protein
VRSMHTPLLFSPRLVEHKAPHCDRSNTAASVCRAKSWSMAEPLWERGVSGRRGAILARILSNPSRLSRGIWAK